MKLSTVFKTFALGLTLISLGACGNTNKQISGSNSETRTLTDSMDHKVEIPAEPKRVIGSYLEDYLVALGIKPVAQWTVGGGSIQDYLQDELKDIPTINYDLPYEDVMSFKPDLLLISSDGLVEGGKYDKYKEIAPTYVVKNGDGVTWKDQLAELGKVFNKENEADKVKADYEQLVKESKEELKDKIAGKSAAVLWITNNSPFLVAENRSSGQLLYNELGFEVPKLTKEVSEKATTDWSAVSLEQLSQLDADYLFVVNSDEEPALFNDPLWQNIPAVKNQQMITLSSKSSWLYNGPIAYTKIVEDIKSNLK